MPFGPSLIQANRSDFSRLAAVLQMSLPTVLKNAAKSGHVKAISNSITPGLRVQRYGELAYRVITSDTPPILGDSIVLFLVQDARPHEPWLDKDDVLTSVFLPLDRQTLLIGSASGQFSVPCDIGEAIAGCSLEYFIADEKTPANEILKQLIGTIAYLLSDSDVENLLEDAWSE